MTKSSNRIKRLLAKIPNMSSLSIKMPVPHNPKKQGISTEICLSAAPNNLVDATAEIPLSDMFQIDVNDENLGESRVFQQGMGDRLLVVLDMDKTMVGDMESLSDRDTIETNIDWTWWPEGQHRGLSVEEIIPYLKEGMLRPGLINFVEYLRQIGATIVVYTHAELRWAQKVTAAIEEVAGFKFIRKLFTRQDCKDFHPEFAGRKSLRYITAELRKEADLSWVSLERAIMFDDEAVLRGGEQERAVRIPPYQFWAPCQWDVVVTPGLLDRNDPALGDIVRNTAIEWGLIRPSHGTPEEELTEEAKARDKAWREVQEQLHERRQEKSRGAANDMLWTHAREAFLSLSDLDEPSMHALPLRLRDTLRQRAAAVLQCS